MGLATWCGCAAPPAVVPGPVPSADPSTHKRVSVTAGSAQPAGLAGTIAFQSDRDGRAKLFTLDLRSGAIARITSGANHHDVEPAWSPDGRRLVFSSTRFDSRTFDLAVAEAAAPDAARRVTTHGAFERQPVWAADGGSLFFAGEHDGTQALFRIALDGGGLVRVSPLPQRALMPAVAPDGRGVAYVQGGTDGLQLVTQELPAGQPMRLSAGAEDAAWPSWSPDGARLACIRLDGESRATLDVIEVASRTRTSYHLEGLHGLREPAWAPDGRGLVVAGAATTGSGSDWDLMFVALDQVPLFVRLTSGRGNDTAPSWSAR